jgi:tetratricopeptide (TPR) repeat protein
MRLLVPALAVLFLASPAQAADEALAKACARPASAEEGVEACTRLIAEETEPARKAAAHNGRALAKARGGDLDGAVADFSEAVKLKPDYAEAFYNRANALDRSGRPDRAIADYDKTIMLQPFMPQPYNNRCWVRAELNKELDKALADCTQALKLKADNPKALDTRGFVHLRMGRNQDAVADYDAALKLNPKLAASLYGRGVARLRLGDGAGAAKDIAEARRLDVNVGVVFDRLGIKP